MTTIFSFLGADHHRCDDLFVEAERLVAAGDPVAAQRSHALFRDAMGRHFTMEEEVLFPAFEQATGSTFGPTMVMRHEHEQMRQLFKEMDDALAAGRNDDYLSASETLLVLMQQHNGKEEQILYSMCDRLLGDVGGVVARMQAAGS